MAATEVAPLLALSPTSAMNLAVLAHDLTRLPATRAALAAGRLDKTRARLVADELRPLPDERPPPSTPSWCPPPRPAPTPSCGPACAAP